MNKLKEIYLSVIIQAIRDIASNNKSKYENAVDWITSKEFIEVCSIVGIQPYTIRQSLLGLLNTNNKKKLSEDIISSISATVWQRENLNE
jgi:hypothetical protein|tara:strand:+ start:441 stop:710 length:270 start_codon:yes stop_codon:yes gene_type:complete